MTILQSAEVAGPADGVADCHNFSVSLLFCHANRYLPARAVGNKSTILTISSEMTHPRWRRACTSWTGAASTSVPLVARILFAVPGFARWEFGDLIARVSWDWLLELVEGLHLAADLVDSEARPALAVSTERTDRRLRALLTSPRGGELQSMLKEVIAAGDPKVSVFDDVEIACCPVTAASGASGAVLVARDVASKQDSASLMMPLDDIGSALARAVGAHLSEADRHQSDSLERVLALQRLLGDAVAANDERKVVMTFAEALAVWDDIEVRGYIQDLQGRYRCEVSLPGADQRPTPVITSADIPRADTRLVRLSIGDAERFGFPEGSDVLAARVVEGMPEPWLILLIGAIAPRDQQRLDVYIGLLRTALLSAASVATTRINWAVLHHLLTAADAPEQAARAALDELNRAVNGIGAALLVQAPNGVHVLSIGDAAVFSTPRAYGGDDQIVASQQLKGGHTMVVAVRRSAGESFSRREQHIVDNAAAVLASWLPQVLNRPAPRKDRRERPRAFAEILNQTAASALQVGSDVSVVVIALESAVEASDAINGCVADIRGQLRPRDLAGRLSDHEIAVLLADTSDDTAATVVKRLRTRLEASEPPGACRPAAVGLACFPAGSPTDRSFVEAARAASRQMRA